MSRWFCFLIALVLSGCSALPGSADDQAIDAAPPEVLALEAPVEDAPAEEAPVGPLPLTTTDDAERMSNRRSLTSRVEPLSVPGLPASVEIVDTEIAVMPETLTSIDVFTVASEYSEIKITFQRFDEFNEPRVFRIVGESGDYYNVQVPMRPNESTGYIRKSDVDVISTDQRILIDLSDRSVIVWNGDEIVLNTTSTIGQPSSPTPTGSFYVRNVFEWYADSIYGPYVIPLSAYSEAIDQINGGDAVVAIHGTQRPDLMGAAASLGCVRLDNDTLRELAAIIEPGAPVEVVE